MWPMKKSGKDNDDGQRNLSAESRCCHVFFHHQGQWMTATMCNDQMPVIADGKRSMRFCMCDERCSVWPWFG
jgi:hypothetical protein